MIATLLEILGTHCITHLFYYYDVFIFVCTTELFTRGVLLNFYFAATNNTIDIHIVKFF
jgi:predicted membrane protein